MLRRPQTVVGNVWTGSFLNQRLRPPTPSLLEFSGGPSVSTRIPVLYSKDKMCESQKSISRALSRTRLQQFGTRPL